MPIMQNPRTYGLPPYTVAVVHGGPGAPGEMAPVARELSTSIAVMEPLQTASSLEGQVEELKTIVERHGCLPVTLIGWSWGALLSYIVAARYPMHVKKLILLASAPFQEKYARDIMKTRIGRLAEKEREELQGIMKALSSPETGARLSCFARFGELSSKADSYDSIALDKEVIEYQPEINESVWSDAAALRRSGELLEMGRNISCPVTAIHGDYDPHPWQGVNEPLSTVIKSFHFILLEKCGHTLWAEKHGRDRFYQILRQEILAAPL